MAKETVYELINIASGVETSLLKTSVIKEAKSAYQKQFRANGTTPRVYVNGAMLTIAQGDKLFIDANEASPWRGNKPTKDKPKYTDTHAKIAEEKTRMNR